MPPALNTSNPTRPREVRLAAVTDKLQIGSSRRKSDARAETSPRGGRHPTCLVFLWPAAPTSGALPGEAGAPRLGIAWQRQRNPREFAQCWVAPECRLSASKAHDALALVWPARNAPVATTPAPRCRSGFVQAPAARLAACS